MGISVGSAMYMLRLIARELDPAGTPVTQAALVFGLASQLKDDADREQPDEGAEDAEDAP